MEVEGVVDFVVGLGELAGVDGVEDGTGIFEWAALATGGGSGTDPAGVQEPGVGLVLGDLVGKHAGIAHWVEGKERLGEARREGGLGFGDTVFGTGHLGGVARDEVEHGLLGGELGDWWEDTAGVAREEDDVGRVLLGDTWDQSVLDILNGVSAAGVLSEGGVVIVNDARLGIENNVLKDGSEADGVEDIGFLLGGEADTLGVASTFDVEDATVTPAVLVITDQGTLWVSGEGGFAGAGQTEEDGNIAILALVGGGVQGEDVVLDGHLIEENGEDALLHLAGVFGAKNDHLPLGKVDGDRSSRGHAFGEAVCRERSGIVNHVVGMEALEFLGRGADKHVAHEESMVGTGADNADIDAVAFIPSSEAVDNVDAISGVEVVDGAFSVDSPHLRAKG